MIIGVCERLFSLEIFSIPKSTETVK